jgi:NitT/TauT family transport system permease protein
VSAVSEAALATKSAEDTSADDGALPSSGWTLKDVAIVIGSLLVLLGGWELAVRLLKISPVILPGPVAIADQLRHLVMSGLVFPHLGITLSEILGGFAIGSVTALVLGSLIAQFRIVDRIVTPYIVALQAIPKVAIAPLLVVWFGFGISSKVLMTAVISFFPVLVNTVVGLRSVEQDRVDLMIALNATRWQVFRYVRLSSALPFIFAGLDVGIVLAVIGAIVGEFVGARGGLGYLILVYNADLKIAAVFALMVVLGTVGITLHGIVTLVQKRVLFWASTGADRMVGV